MNINVFLKPLGLLLMFLSFIAFQNCSSDSSSDDGDSEKEDIHNYIAFESQRITSSEQTVEKTFNLHDDLSNIETIKMYIKLDCPSVGCNAWDVYANIKIKDKSKGSWYEIGRYITPYGVKNTLALERGFEIDVTDFKSLLKGNVELRARIETWGSDGWELSVDFDYIEGTPDYKYYAIANIFDYDDWSWSGVPYGVSHNFDLEKTVEIPSNAEATSLRTILSGWGHATPNDVDGRGCAEWCFRTHRVLIDGDVKFAHAMNAIGCGENPVNYQKGNWAPDRAGWCPGMEVPVREDKFSSNMAGKTFTYKYDFQDWTSDGESNAYVAISSFVVVKSNTEIIAPVVTD